MSQNFKNTGFTLLQTLIARFKHRRFVTGFTLTELLIAITLVGMIMLAVISLDVSCRRFFLSSFYDAAVQDRISPIVELIVKDALTSVGKKDDPGIVIASNIIKIRHLDTNNPPTYTNYNDDSWIAYRFVDNTIERRFCADSSCSSGADTVSTVAKNIENCEFNFTDDLMVGITVTATRQVGASTNDLPNPKVRIETTVASRLESS